MRAVREQAKIQGKAKRISFRLSEDDWRAMTELADQHWRTINAEFVQAVQFYLDHQKEQKR